MGNMKNKKITVVIPIYNGERYIEKTLYSIINQTFKNLEIILIDDGSIDSSFEICKKFANKDSRIKAYHQSNKGVSAARNYGLEIATGEYVIFIDSDDILDNIMLEEMYKKIEEESADICCCGIKIVDENGKLIKEKQIVENSIMNRRESIIEFLTKARFGISLWNKLVKKSIAKKFSFEEGKSINEDKFYLFLLLMEVNRICIIDKTYYNYVQRKQSLSRTKFNEKNLDIIYFSNKIENVIYNNFYDLYKYSVQNKIKDYIYVYRNIIRNYSQKDYIYTETFKIRMELKRYIKKYGVTNKLNFLEAYMICYINKGYIILLRLFDKTIRKWRR